MSARSFRDLIRNLWHSPRSRRAGTPGRTRPRYRPLLRPLEDRVMPATVYWINPNSGDWSVPGNWSTGQLPGSADDAVIELPGITVTHSAGTNRVNSLVTANGTFQLTGGTLDVATTVSGNSAFRLGGGRLANATVAAGTALSGTGFRGTLDRVTLAAGASLTPAGTDVVNGLDVDGTVHLGGELHCFAQLYPDSAGFFASFPRRL